MDHKTYDNFELINTTDRLTPQRLWKTLNNHFDDNQEFSNNFNKRKAWEKRYYNLDWKGPYPKLFVSYLRSNNILRITIYFFEEKELFNKAVRLKNELEKTLNCKLVIDYSTEKTQNIYYERNDIDPYGDEQYLANLVKWIQDTALEFKKAIYKHIHSSQPSSELRQYFTVELFEKAYLKFMEQADKNVISQKAEGKRIPYGFNERNFFDSRHLSQFFGNEGATKSPYINWWIVSIYYVTSSRRIAVGIIEKYKNIYDQINLRPISLQRIAPNNENAAVFYETTRETVNYKELLDHFIDVCEEVMRIRSNVTSKVSDFKPIPDNPIDELDYQLKIGDETVSEVEAESYVPNPEPRKQTIRVSEGEKYPRDPRQAKIALIRANNKCEHVEEHWTFIRKTDSLPYTEPHHLIPISQYKRFDIDLDVPANIVSLCSNCHNCVHYGLEYERNEILSKLYDKKKAELEQAGIDISLDDLKAMYE